MRVEKSSKTMHPSTKVRLGAIVKGGKNSKTMHLCSRSHRQGGFEVFTVRTVRMAEAHYRNVRVYIYIYIYVGLYGIVVFITLLFLYGIVVYMVLWLY